MNALLILSGLLGLAVSLILIPLILKLSSRLSGLQRAPDLHHHGVDSGKSIVDSTQTLKSTNLDNPQLSTINHRQVPRFGGLALALAFVAVEILIGLVLPGEWTRTQSVVLISSLAMFGLGFWDDLRPLGAKRKLLGQVLIALTVCGCGIGIQSFQLPFGFGVISLGNWGVAITVLWLVGMTNLINLIDGVDGLAGGICLMLMLLMAYVGHQTGNFELLAAGMAGALLGFLWFNFPPARIYMGDGGAYFLGFQAGLFALVNSHKGEVFAALAAPLFVLALPIADTLLALLRRGLRGLPLFRPDRRHLHHRLLEHGLSRRRVTLSFYALTLVFLALGMMAYLSRGKLVPLLFGLTMIILLFCAGQFSFSRRWFAITRTVGDSLEMRSEIEYALSLTRVLALEGRRQASLEDLWSSLVHTAERLGFNSVKLTLDGKVRTADCGLWTDASAECGMRSAESNSPINHQLSTINSPLTVPCGRAGTLELQAPAELDAADSRLVEIIADLVAEGWLKAVTAWQKAQPVPAPSFQLRFDSRPLVWDFGSGLRPLATSQPSEREA